MINCCVTAVQWVEKRFKKHIRMSFGGIKKQQDHEPPLHKDS